MTLCGTLKCAQLRTRDKRMAVWSIDGKPYCNVCYLNWLESGQWMNQKIIRLFNDENLYVDIRTQKRRKPIREVCPSGPPMALRV